MGSSKTCLEEAMMVVAQQRTALGDKRYCAALETAYPGMLERVRR